MRFPKTPLVARLLLVLMLTTFLSPSLAWHMNDGHQEIAVEAHCHDHDGDHRAATDDQGAAHASIGHLLGHLPMQISRVELPIPAAEQVAPGEDVATQRLAAESSPPYRPPLPIRLA